MVSVSISSSDLAEAIDADYGGPDSGHLRLRTYDPSAGRLLTIDSYAGDMFNPQSFHKYGYVHANPIINIDPSGEITFSLNQLLVTAGVVAVIAGIYYVPTLFSKAATPRTVNLTINVSTRNKPSNFNNKQVEARLNTFLSNHLFDNVVSGQKVVASIVDSSSQPGNLGWSGTPKSGFVTWIEWKDQIPFGGFAITDRTTSIDHRKLKLYAGNLSQRPNWDHFYANIIAHEVIWLGAGSNRDNLLAKPGDVSSGTVPASGFPSVSDASREDLIKAFELKSR